MRCERSGVATPYLISSVRCRTMRSERLLANFIEQAPGVMAMFDRDMRYIATSEHWRSEYRLGADLIGRSHYEVFPEISEDWKEIHRRALAGEVLVAEKDLFSRLDGSAQWLKWEVRPWYRPEGGIGGIVIFSEDITERVNLHEALRLSEERFRHVANITNDVIFDWDLRSSKIWWNEGFIAGYGLGSGTITTGIGAWIDRIVPADRQRVSQAIQSFMEGDSTEWSDEYRVVQANGATAMVLDNRSVIRDAQGKVMRMLGCIADVTKHKLADEKFRLVVEASPSGMVMTDAGGKIVLVNVEAERLFGYRRDELIGKPIEMLVPPRIHGEHVRFRDGFQDNPEARSMGKGRDLHIVRKDGTELPVEIGLNSIRASEGMMVLSAIIDISERKRATQALAKRSEELQRSNDDLEQFAYVASHDLQEPLRMVANYTELRSEHLEGTLDEKGEKYIRYAVDGAKRMQQLIKDLLAYSRVDSQGSTPVRVKSENVMRNVLDSLKIAIEESHAEIVYEALPDVFADKVQLTQVLQNLIGNALKFRGKCPPQVHIGTELRNDKWLFRVEDNGIGIEKQCADQVFQMFKRLHERGRYTGSGIGLAIAKKIVERHGGRIWFDSEPGRGSTFYFTMPAAQGDVA